MTRAAPDLVEMIAPVEVLSATRHALRGRVHDSADVTRGSFLPEAPPRVSALAHDLYIWLYTRPRETRRPAAGWASRDLIASLSAANTGRGRWEAGWTVKSRAPRGPVVVEKDGLSLWVSPAQFREVGAPPGMAAAGQVWLGKEHLASVPGYYMAVGDSHEADGPGVRLYWHVTAASAAAVCAGLTTALNEAAVPFRLKLLSHPAAYVRADSAVLYLRRDDLWRAAPTLAEAHRRLAAQLRAGVPRLTCRLAPGLGLAEDPDGGLSFGQHRCRLIAEALWAAFERGATGLPERIEAVTLAFVDRGLDPARPHLQPGSPDGYPSLFSGRRGPGTRPLRRRAPAPAPASPLMVAAQIGDDLCRRAYWHDGRCNWLGHARVAPAVNALGPELYDGTAGVALFLGRLFTLTGEPAHRRAAEGAIRHALYHARALPRSRRLGLHHGSLGIAYAAGEVGRLLGHEALLAPAGVLAADAVSDLEGPGAPPRIVGLADAIVALLAMRSWPEGERLLEGAVALGERLRVQAARQGGAGAALALLELHAATWRPALLEASLRALSRQDEALGGGDPHRSAVPARASRTAWCQGAAGAGLARLQCLSLLPERDAQLLPGIEAALRRTTRRLRELEREWDVDATPCHGLAGLTELALTAGRALARPPLEQAARQAWEAEIGKRGTAPEWTTGVPGGGFNPSLMVGTAGIGYGLLRLHDPARVPSVLVLPVTGPAPASDTRRTPPRARPPASRAAARRDHPSTEAGRREGWGSPPPRP